MAKDPLSPDALKSTWQKAVALARRKNFPMEAEDFGSYAVVQRLQGRVDTYVGVLWVDYLRHRFGMSDADSNRMMEYTSWDSFQTEHSAQREDGEQYTERRGVVVASVDFDLAEFFDLCALQKLRYVQIITLLAFEGMTKREAAEELGITEQRLGQIVYEQIAPALRRRMRQI